jgi:hypothetical protein
LSVVSPVGSSYTGTRGSDTAILPSRRVDANGLDRVSPIVTPMIEFGGRYDIDETTILRPYLAVGLNISLNSPVVVANPAARRHDVGGLTGSLREQEGCLDCLQVESACRAKENNVPLNWTRPGSC